ncbi:putative 4-coumarate--CoA ligase, partial [Zalerion maritima]
GYKDNPAATKETITDGGWYRTGDLGYIDDLGFLVMYDRIKDIIKVKGFQVSPVDLEEILARHPLVDEAAVCGVWSESDSSDLPRAYVVLTDKAAEKPKAAASISDFVSGQVSTYKRLTGGVVFVDALPKNTSGKVLRRVLRTEKAKYEKGFVLAKL